MTVIPAGFFVNQSAFSAIAAEAIRSGRTIDELRAMAMPTLLRLCEKLGLAITHYDHRTSTEQIGHINLAATTVQPVIRPSATMVRAQDVLWSFR